MAKKQTQAEENKKRKYNIVYKTFAQQDIQEINRVRFEEGFKSLPIRKFEWYEKLIEYSKKKYTNYEFAVKAIAIQVPYSLVMNIQNNKSYIQKLDKYVKTKTYWGNSLDTVIRSGNVEQYGSETINMLADKYQDDFAIRVFKTGRADAEKFLVTGKIKAI